MANDVDLGIMRDRWMLIEIWLVLGPYFSYDQQNPG